MLIVLDRRGRRIFELDSGYGSGTDSEFGSSIDLGFGFSIDLGFGFSIGWGTTSGTGPGVISGIAPRVAGSLISIFVAGVSSVELGPAASWVVVAIVLEAASLSTGITSGMVVHSYLSFSAVEETTTIGVELTASGLASVAEVARTVSTVEAT